MFRSRNLTGATFVRVLFPIGMFGQFFLGALYLQHVLGYSAITTGLAFMPMNLAVGIFSLTVAARIMTRIGAKATLLPGLALIATGLALFSRVPVHGHYLTDVLPGMAPLRHRRRAGLHPLHRPGHGRRRPGRYRPGLGTGQRVAADGGGHRHRRAGQRLHVTQPGALGREGPVATPRWPAATTSAISSPPAASSAPSCWPPRFCKDRTIGKAQTEAQRTALHMGEGESGF